MEFDKSRVYTALNADELKAGSKVVYSDRIADLKEYVANDDHLGDIPTHVGILTEVLGEEYLHRFKVKGCEWALAYLVEEPKKPRRMTNRELAKWLAKGNGQWRTTVSLIARTSWEYSNAVGHKDVQDDIVIRGWDEEEWHEPLVEEN